MKHILEEELLLKRFLLGQLSQGEQSEVEERLFADPEYFNQFRAAEDELIDEYLCGDLDAGERERFKGYFLTTPERRESLRVAKALQRYISKNSAAAAAERVDEAPAPRSAKKSILDIFRVRVPALRLSAVAALVLVASFAMWLVLRTGTRDEPAPALRAERPDTPQPSPTEIAQGEPGQNNQETIAPPPPEGNRNANTGKGGGVSIPRPPRRPPARAYSFMILPLRRVRGEGEVNEVKLPADAGLVNLQIPLIDEVGYRRYRVALQTDARGEIKAWSNLKPTKGEAGQSISVSIPAKSLNQQKYRLVLSGVSNSEGPRIISTFHFKVTK